MSAPIVERAYASLVERGHCKCCCDKWHPVRKPPPRITPRYRYGPKFDLHWKPRKRCTCYPWHKEGD